MVKHKAPAPPADGDAESRILDAAHAVFVRRGTVGARMQEIADEAGVNKALLHYYFRSKERLADAVFQRVARTLFPKVAEVALSNLELEEKVRRIIAAYIEQFVLTPYAPAYLIGEMSQHPERAAQLLEALGANAKGASAQHFLSKLAAQIDEGVKAGRYRPISPRQFLTNLVSLCIFPFAARPMLCAVFRMNERGFHDFLEERKATLPEFFLSALRP